MLILRILSKIKDGSSWYGVDYNMNLYRGCPHGCIYCDARSRCYQMDHVFEDIEVKGNAIEYLKECGFSYEAAEEVLVPYTVAYDTSSAYTSFSFGGGFALVSIVCFAIWIRKGMNFRD